MTPEGVNSDQGSLQVDRLVGLSIPGKDNPLSKLVQGLDVDGVGLPEHLHLVPVPRVVNRDREIEGLVFNLGFKIERKLMIEKVKKGKRKVKKSLHPLDLSALAPVLHHRHSHSFNSGYLEGVHF